MKETTDLFTQLVSGQFGVKVVKEYKFHPKRKWAFDYCIPSHKIAIENEGGVWTGGRHTHSTGFLKDMEKYNEASALGYRLIRTTPQDLLSAKTLDLIERLLKL